MKLPETATPTTINAKPATDKNMNSASKLVYRRSVRPVMHPQFKERMILPLLVETPVAPGSEADPANH